MKDYDDFICGDCGEYFPVKKTLNTHKRFAHPKISGRRKIQHHKDDSEVIIRRSARDVTRELEFYYESE